MGVTGRGGVLIADGSGGGGTFSGGGVAVVSGATVVSGFESASEGSGVTVTGALALTVFCPHPIVAVTRPQTASMARYRGVIEGWATLFAPRMAGQNLELFPPAIRASAPTAILNERWCHDRPLSRILYDRCATAQIEKYWPSRFQYRPPGW